MTRTFIAIALPEAVRSALEREIRRLERAAPEVRWVNPTGLHLTLAFLGELDDEALRSASDATKQTAEQSRPFTLRLADLGTFGSQASPRVIWAGVSGEMPLLQALQHMLASALEERGFPREARPFSPHLTLARLKAPLPELARDRLASALARSHLAWVEWRVADIAVMKSELHCSGALYLPVQVFPLGSGR